MTFDHVFTMGAGFAIGFFVACMLLWVIGWLRQSSTEAFREGE